MAACRTPSVACLTCTALCWTGRGCMNAADVARSRGTQRVSDWVDIRAAARQLVCVYALFLTGEGPDQVQGGQGEGEAASACGGVGSGLPAGAPSRAVCGCCRAAPLLPARAATRCRRDALFYVCGLCVSVVACVEQAAMAGGKGKRKVCTVLVLAPNLCAVSVVVPVLPSCAWSEALPCLFVFCDSEMEQGQGQRETR